MNIAACIDRHMTMWRPKKEQMRQLLSLQSAFHQTVYHTVSSRDPCYKLRLGSGVIDLRRQTVTGQACAGIALYFLAVWQMCTKLLTLHAYLSHSLALSSTMFLFSRLTGAKIHKVFIS